MEADGKRLGPVGELETMHIIAKIQASTETGMDGFPASLLKKNGFKVESGIKGITRDNAGDG